ncbi:hypothetical protein AF35_00234 [Enterobacter roggenkampii CHS 79]|nr:hypothetical protein AF35_00234 [Enterobacter roggenkampii CHS 79]
MLRKSWHTETYISRFKPADSDKSLSETFKSDHVVQSFWGVTFQLSIY